MAKILLVEDDNALAVQVANVLRAQDYLVDVARSGVEARSFLRASSYDLIIIDWVLPDSTGIEICKEVRAPGADGVAVLFLTGRSAVADKELGFDSGADDYLTKPFHPSELVARVKALLRRPHIRKSRQLAVRDIHVDLDTHEVFQNGKKIELFPKEFALLEFLISHPKQVFSADALLRRIWSTDSEVTPGAVGVTVRRLRQKLISPENKPLIITLKNIGYRLEP